MEKGSVGCLSVDDPFGSKVSVYVLQGEILATSSESDGEEVLGRLLNSGAITPSLMDRLHQQMEITGRLSDVLFGVVPDELVLGSLHDRFKENICRYLLGTSPPVFQSLETIFVENVQIGHDSRQLLREASEIIAETRALYLQAQDISLSLGAEMPGSADEARLLDLIESQPILSDLFGVCPVERHELLMLLTQMVERGSIVMTVRASGSLRSGQDTSPPTLETAVMASPGEEPPRRTLSASSPRSEQPASSPSVVEHEDLEHLSPDLLEPMPGLANRLGAFHVPEPAGAADAFEPIVDGEDSEPETTEIRPQAASPAGQQLGVDPVLAMFQDHEMRRDGGEFSMSKEHLDYVDLDGGVVVPEAPDDPEEQFIEVGDAEDLPVKEAGRMVSLSFTSPVLTQDDALRKLEVTNTVLREICHTLDQENGIGSGQAAVQLLLEGAPAAFAGLFIGVEAARDGAFAADRAMRNLNRRPDTERRSLLNQALKNLIERGLSVTFETVSEERLDAMLERIAGFQQRMGI